MKERAQILDQLLRAAGHRDEAAQMPFGFDTRVLALAGKPVTNGSAVIAGLARQAIGLAVAVIALAVAGLVGLPVDDSNAEIRAQYSMADAFIQNNLAE